MMISGSLLEDQGEFTWMSKIVKGMEVAANGYLIAKHS